MAVAVAGVAGAEGSLVGPAAAVSQSALLAVLSHVALGAGARLHPVGRGAGALASGHQGNVVQVAGAWRRNVGQMFYSKSRQH